MDTDGADIDKAVAELYGVAPADFIATRNRLAKEHPELATELRALRRPTLSAWAVNQLARSAADEVGWLFDVGTELRAAWESGEHIGGVEQRRGELIARLIRTTRELAAAAGHPLRDPAVREVEETLQAATVDPAVAEEVRAGRLAQPRSHAGFGFGPMAAPAPPAAGRAAAPPARPAAKRRDARQDREKDRAKDRAAEIARLEDEVQAAAGQADEARRDFTEWEERAAAVRDEIAAIDAEMARLTRALEEARGRQAAANRKAQVTQRERNRAARTAETARARADEARTKLERARRKRPEAKPED